MLILDVCKKQKQTKKKGLFLFPVRLQLECKLDYLSLLCTFFFSSKKNPCTIIHCKVKYVYCTAAVMNVFFELKHVVQQREPALFAEQTCHSFLCHSSSSSCLTCPQRSFVSLLLILPTTHDRCRHVSLPRLPWQVDEINRYYIIQEENVPDYLGSTRYPVNTERGHVGSATGKKKSLWS